MKSIRIRLLPISGPGPYSIGHVTSLLKNLRCHPSTHRKITILTFKATRYPLSSAPLPFSDLLSVWQFSLTKFVHSRSLFSTILWLSYLHGLLISACTTLLAFSYLNLTLLWRWRFVSYIITFLNTPDYRNYFPLWTPTALAFLM